MLQLTQKLKDGEVRVQEVPLPQLGRNMVLVQNHYSVISAGTEGATAASARKSLIAKAKERPQQVRQVFEVLRRQGAMQTYRAVTKKLEAYSPCGYSSAGEVVAIGDDVTEFAVGDKVACAGVGYANHAEVVAVPVNLCVKLNADANLADAAYNTLGAIAMEGVRQADLRVGECVAVIGLGLIGLLTVQLLRASGVRVAAIDISERAVRIAEECCGAELCVTRNALDIESRLADFSNHHGVDAVLITAATSSLDPINFAGKIARQRGCVVIVGAVPTGYEREFYYRKELSVKMSCSYGPGRYDERYEEEGIDYPYGYVRWTEKRNMEAFQALLHAGKLNIAKLTTHEFCFDEAPKAYELITTRTEPFVGLVLKYDIAKTVASCTVKLKEVASEPASVGIAFIGAGSYAQGNLLPNLPRKDPAIAKVAVLANSGTTSKRVCERFGFAAATDDIDSIWQDARVNTVFIATRHDSHAEYVIDALKHNMNVFVEKPLALNMEELAAIDAARENSTSRLLVGFNRRFAPLARELKSKVGNGRMSMFFRVNAGMIPGDNWIQNPRIGGGRMIGEGCHFIDFMSWMCGSEAVSVHAVPLLDGTDLNDTLNINLTFANGSTGTLLYWANGNKSMPKEYFELSCSGLSAQIHDFRSLEIFGKKHTRIKHLSQDKGQSAMVAAYLATLKSGGPELIPYRELRAVTLATFAAMQSIREQAPIRINQ